MCIYTTLLPFASFPQAAHSTIVGCNCLSAILTSIGHNCHMLCVMWVLEVEKMFKMAQVSYVIFRPRNNFPPSGCFFEDNRAICISRLGPQVQTSCLTGFHVNRPRSRWKYFINNEVKTTHFRFFSLSPQGAFLSLINEMIISNQL